MCVCGSSPLQWLLHTGQLMCSKLGHTHIYNQYFWSGPLDVECYLDPAQVCSRGMPLLRVRGCNFPPARQKQQLSLIYLKCVGVDSLYDAGVPQRSIRRSKLIESKSWYFFFFYLLESKVTSLSSWKRN